MERKGLVRHKFLALILSLAFCSWFHVSCSEVHTSSTRTTDNSGYAEVKISFSNAGFSTRAINPDEEAICNLNLLVYNIDGILEQSIWRDGADADESLTLHLLAGKEYRFLACANFGYEITETCAEDLLEHRFHMAYPDEYQEGIPMTADSGIINIEKDSFVSLEMIRMMSKISLRMDRRGLSDDVDMKVRSIKIGNCPKSAKAFGKSSIYGHDECFSSGFTRTSDECAPLNQMAETGISRTISLYMLENLQGNFSEVPIDKDSCKIFDKHDPRREICSYIEVEMDYLSPDWKSIGQGLIYRFYLGENRNNLDVERNCHYRISICPKDDGLSEDSWRVDKSSIYATGPVSFSSWPDSYIRGNIGDKIHIGCTFTPAYAPFDVGLEYMEEDKARGIYDFEIDSDGHGATLTLTGPGRGLIYMEAGDPVNEAAMWIIEVNLPDS